MTRSRHFRSRLRFIQAPALVFLVIMICRLVQVQALEHQKYLDEGTSQWLDLVPLPAERGNLYDRNGRSLALSATTWHVGLSPKTLHKYPSSVQHHTCARVAAVFGLDTVALWRKLRAAGSHHLVVARAAVLHRDSIEVLRTLPGISLDACRDRIYPYAGLGASLIGSYHERTKDPDVMTGLEQSLDPLLRGRPGEAWRHNTPAKGPGTGFEVMTRAVDGQDLVLSLDTELQAIAEDCLASSITECHAIGGIVMIVDPATGDLLAAADSPVIQDRAEAEHYEKFWDNFNFTGTYEPGSVMKIFTAAALLSRGAVDTTLAIDCDDGQFPGYLIHNSEGHDFGMMSFNEAFIHSSNVYFARMVLNLKDEEFYTNLRLFGFGKPVGIAYPGQTAGIIKSPRTWSKRSQSTIAYGHEISMSPVQLVMAGAAVANGGKLMAPRLVRQVRSKSGAVMEDFAPVVRQVVMKERVAASLRRVMARVVTEGTGKRAAVDWVPVAGKTGTAHKSIENVVGYPEGLYMSSFLGMVPAESPRLVILTMLDEPDKKHYYASQCAAPLFAKIVEEIGGSSPWLQGVSRSAGSRVATQEEPNSTANVESIHQARLEAVFNSDAHLNDGAAGGVICPDFQGFSGREMRRIASYFSVPLRCRGTGYVMAQSPSPGAAVGPEGIRVVMEAPWCRP